MEWNELNDTLRQVLVPAGDGVFTVHTSQGRKAEFQKKYYHKNPKKIEEVFHKKITALNNTQPVVLGICSDIGSGILRGSNWGPMTIRETNIKYSNEINYNDIGDIKVVPHFSQDSLLNEETLKKIRKSLYNDDNSPLPVSPLSLTEFVTDHIYEVFPNKKIISLGGDHSISYPLIKSFLKYNPKSAVIHFDAHTDLLKERMGVSICFGSWAYHILKFLETPENLIQIGLRSSDKEKEYWEDELKVKQYWANQVQSMGGQAISEKIITILKKNNVEKLYITLDIDVIDTEYVTCTGTPEPAGLPPHIPMEILKNLATEFKIGGADIVEVAPYIDHQNRFQHKTFEPESTLMVANSFFEFFVEIMNEQG